MTKYYRVRLGRGNTKAEQCRIEGFIGAHYDVDLDLSHILVDEVRAFNQEFRPIYQKIFPNNSKASASTVGSIIWRISKGIKRGDVVLSPRTDGTYQIGEVTSEYYFEPNTDLPHRRSVNWSERLIEPEEISDTMELSINSRNTVISLDQYSDDIELLVSHPSKVVSVSLDDDIEDLSSFAMEKHLEEFLIANWAQSELGQEYDIFEEGGELVGQQYITDTGPLDILAISKDKKTLLVVELKKGRASDAVVGQVTRYMGYVLEELAEPHQQVKGAIIALEDTQRLRRARSVVPNIEFYRYEISFKLIKE